MGMTIVSEMFVSEMEERRYVDLILCFEACGVMSPESLTRLVLLFICRTPSL